MIKHVDIAGTSLEKGELIWKDKSIGMGNRARKLAWASDCEGLVIKQMWLQKMSREQSWLDLV